MRCYCPACTDEPRPTYTEAHRHACEVAMVVDMPGRRERVAYFAMVRDKRGSVAARELRAAAIAAWRAKHSVPERGACDTATGGSPTGIGGAR